MGAYYNYDASGERNLKLTGAVVHMSQNGVPYDYVMLESPTLYASGLITINERGYTKHYFEENKRVCSNIGGGFRNAGYDIMDSIELITPFLEQWRNAKDGIFKTFEQCIKSPVDLDNTQEKIVKVMKNHEKNRNEEEYQFYYTNDHLGSSTYITNKEGQITQTLAYLPYGEDWVDLDNQPPYITPYKFNGKEKDQETGYNYYGARYYWDKGSFWLSVDPMSDKYPHLTSYNYCANNPVMLIDPDGREIWINGDDGNNYQYKDRKLFLNGEEYTGNDKFATNSRGHLNKLKDNGMNDEISGLEASFNKHNMQRNEGNSWDPSNNRDASNGKGTGSTINYNPDQQSFEGWDRAPEVGLAHEMQHASDGDLGKYDNSTIELSRTIGIGNKVDKKYSKYKVDIENANLPGTNIVKQTLRMNFERGEFKAIKTANKVNPALGGKVNRTKINGFKIN